MQARLESKGEVVVVHLSGRVDVETSVPFRKACLAQLRGRKVVFNLKNLSFVGSSGLIPFFESVHEFGEANEHGLKFCAVGQEFRKILSATPLVRFEVLDNETLAVMSYERMNMPQPAVAVVPAPVQMAAPTLAPILAPHLTVVPQIPNAQIEENEPVEAPKEVEAPAPIDLFQMVRSGFEEKMRRPIELVAENKAEKET